MDSGYMRFAALVTAANLVAGVKEPMRRPHVPLFALTGVLAGLIVYPSGQSGPIVAAAAFAAAVVMLILTASLSVIVEAVACRRADRYWIRSSGGGVTACGMVRSNRAGEWILKSMAAWPLGQGAGDQLLQMICVEADQAGTLIRLSPSTPRIAGWYRRHGFAPTGKGRDLVRPPCPPDEFG